MEALGGCRHRQTAEWTTCLSSRPTVTKAGFLCPVLCTPRTHSVSSSCCPSSTETGTWPNCSGVSCLETLGSPHCTPLLHRSELALPSSFHTQVVLNSQKRCVSPAHHCSWLHDASLSEYPISSPRLPLSTEVISPNPCLPLRL